MRQFARSVEIAELVGPLPRPGRRRLRHRRAGGRLPAEPPPGRLPAHPPRQLPRHHPRRRGIRAAVHLGGAAVVRRRAPRATASASSTTSRCPPMATSSMGRLAQYVRDVRVPLEMCPTSNVHTGAVASIDGAPHRPPAPAALPRHREHRQPPHERRDAERRVRVARARPSASASTRCSGCRSNAMKSLVPGLRRAPAAHQRRHQARLRTPHGRGPGALPDARRSAATLRPRARDGSAASSTSDTDVAQHGQSKAASARKVRERERDVLLTPGAGDDDHAVTSVSGCRSSAGFARRFARRCASSHVTAAGPAHRAGGQRGHERARLDLRSDSRVTGGPASPVPDRWPLRADKNDRARVRLRQGGLSTT